MKNQNAPLVEGGQTMVGTALTVGGCALLAGLVAAFCAAPLVAGFALGAMATAVGFVVWVKVRPGPAPRLTKQQHARQVCEELRRRWEAEA